MPKNHSPENHIVAPQREPLMTTREAAAYLRLTPNTLNTLRWRGLGPAFIKLGNGFSIRYRFSDLERWVNEGALDSERGE